MRRPVRALTLTAAAELFISFDHYFGTYPYAANPAGEPAFHASPSTPTVTGLYNDVTSSGQPTGPLLTTNPNKSSPERLDRNDPMTCDQDHGYTDEQTDVDHGAMDLFAQTTGRNKTLATCLAGLSDNGSAEPVPADASSNYAAMDYYSQPPNAPLFLNPSTGERISFSYLASHFKNS